MVAITVQCAAAGLAHQTTPSCPCDAAGVVEIITNDGRVIKVGACWVCGVVEQTLAHLRGLWPGRLLSAALPNSQVDRPL